MRAGSKILPQVARLIAHGAYANSRSFNDAIFWSGPGFDLDCEAALFLLVWSITARVSADPNSCSRYEPITNYFCPTSILTAQVYATLPSCQPSCDWGVCES